MNKKDYVEKILEIGTFISFIALVITVLIQIFTRFFPLGISFIWTEEATRFLFIFSIAFAAPLAMKNKEYVNVDLILNILPKNIRKIFDIMIDLLSVVLFIIVFFQAIKFAKLGVGQTSPAMRIPAYVNFSSISIMAFFVLYYALGNLRNQVRSLDKRGDFK
ncbi:TRAP transporter small permease [Tepidanaerobacter syntrophicus]|uniref:TRAP transporter small permease n=1 Tax=Tepidanaerobacter syntrophicus TaxID=224999 RepID=UPI001BD2DCD6|nr:TRAP transporter small permease [Tepidanaerobacter syntrophicus]